MPIEGKFYTQLELVYLIGRTRQRISAMFRDCAIEPGLYPAEVVEPELENRNIIARHLPVRTFDHPEGITRKESEKEFDDMIGDRPEDRAAADAAGVAFRHADDI